MFIIYTVGIWALVIGRITLTQNLKFEGRSARIYGGYLLFSAIVVGRTYSLLFVTLPNELIRNSFIVMPAKLLGVVLTLYLSALISQKIDERISQTHKA